MISTRFSSAHRALAAACVAFALIQIAVTVINVALARIGTSPQMVRRRTFSWSAL